jgi:hypothetical protein
LFAQESIISSLIAMAGTILSIHTGFSVDVVKESIDDEVLHEMILPA